MKVFHVTYETGEDTYRQAKVTFEDDGLWPQVEIDEAKEVIANIYGCDTKSVRTDEEQKQDEIALNKYLNEESKKLSQQPPPTIV